MGSLIEKPVLLVSGFSSQFFSTQVLAILNPQPRVNISFLGIDLQRPDLAKNRYTVAHFLAKIYFCRDFGKNIFEDFFNL